VKKQIGFIMVMLVVLAGLGIALFVLGGESAAPPEQVFVTETEYIHIIGNARYVTVSNIHGDYTIRLGDDPAIIGFEELPLDIFYFLHFIIMSERLVSRGLVTEAAQDLPGFGLAPPRARVRIRAEAGEATVLIGANAPDGNVYVKLDGSPRIYLASPFDVGIFLRDAFALVDTTLTPPPRTSPDGTLVFDRITFGGQVREEITIVQSEADRTAVIFRGPYQITSPINAPVGRDQALLLEAVFSLNASRVVAANVSAQELARFGLAEPWSTLEVSGADGTFRLLASRPGSAGTVYIHRPGTPLIFEAFAFTLPWLEISFFELMDRTVLLPHIDTVASIDVLTPGRTVTFSLYGEGTALAVNAGGSALDVRNFRTFYQNLVSARFDEYGGIPFAALPPPFLQVIFHYRDGGTDTVSFHEAAARRVLTSLNRGRPHFTLEAYTDHILDDLERVLAGQAVRSFL